MTDRFFYCECARRLTANCSCRRRYELMRRSVDFVVGIAISAAVVLTIWEIWP